MPHTQLQKGLNPDVYLHRDTLLHPEKLKQIATRDGYGEGLLEAGEKNKNVVVLCPDVTESTRSLAFKQSFPERFIQLGVSEQSMASIGAGMALAGKISFLSCYAAFCPGRNWEQIRTCIALQKANVKITGSHAGVSVGPDGATHQMLEDLALMRVLPNMIVTAPCDSVQTKKATLAFASFKGPGYLRFSREKTPAFTTEKTPFKIGRAEIYYFGNDLTLIATGPLVYEALLSAQKLSCEGIQARVINCHTIKPLDKKIIIRAAKETGAIVTIEEAQAAGGLGGAISETLALTTPVVMEHIGMQNCFGESGESEILLQAFGLTSHAIVLAAKRVLQRKHGERVCEIPEYKTFAEQFKKEQQEKIMKQALARTPKKWL
jgi:transketolase